MEERIRAWLESLEGHTSCLACVARRVDRPGLQRRWSEELAAEALEYASRSVIDLFRVLRLHQQPSEYLQWTFEQGVLHCVYRSDDWHLVIASRLEPPLPEERLASWVQEFLQLTAG